jgi:acyl-CoA dehydrogenase
MPDLDLPFFEPRHRSLATDLDAWAAGHVHVAHDADIDAQCRKLVHALGEAGWLKHAIGDIDTRAVCIIRETLARHDGLADFAFAMQGLGSGAISLFGTADQKARYAARASTGAAIAAFALSEPGSGSDAAALGTSARAEGAEYVLNGEKTWISNAGIADFYVVFARAEEGITAFVVEAGTPGFVCAERIEVMAPHPLGRLTFDNCRVPAANVVGEPGKGFKVAMATLDVFRTSVAAAALGFARRAPDEALRHAKSRSMFGQKLADFQLTQAKLATMATGIDAAALLTYRAAWRRDQGQRVTIEAAMAKMVATETAQQAIDAAVQMLGALGVVHDNPVERLYREIRPLRIYEGATEVQQLIIARGLLKDA